MKQLGTFVEKERRIITLWLWKTLDNNNKKFAGTTLIKCI